MQKLPEVPDKKRGDACAKKRNLPDKSQESRSLSAVTSIGLYTPINYFGRYATCSHKDGGRSIFSLGKPLARRTT